MGGWLAGDLSKQLGDLSALDDHEGAAIESLFQFAGDGYQKYGEHVDYLHDGHAHYSHGDHYDECVLDDVHTPAEPHEHSHGAGCGHPTTEHGEHVDYLHDGHRHAPHEDHYDEH